MNWKQHMAKILSVFLTGYGGGLTIVLSIKSVQDGIDMIMLAAYPIMSGVITLIPYAGKILGEYSNGTKTKTS